MKIEGHGLVGDDGVIGDGCRGSLPQVERDGVACAAKVAEVSVVRTRLAIERSGHAKTVCHDGVVRQDRGVLVWPPFECCSTVSVGSRVGYRHVAGSGIYVGRVHAVLGVVTEDGVIDVGVEAGAARSSDAIAVAAGALAIAGDCVALVGIVLIASAELYD